MCDFMDYIGSIIFGIFFSSVKESTSASVLLTDQLSSARLENSKCINHMLLMTLTGRNSELH